MRGFACFERDVPRLRKLCRPLINLGEFKMARSFNRGECQIIGDNAVMARVRVGGYASLELKSVAIALENTTWGKEEVCFFLWYERLE